MTVSYFVRYDITTKDTAEFVRYYREVHLPHIAVWPGLKRIVLHTPAAGAVAHQAMTSDEVWRKGQ